MKTGFWDRVLVYLYVLITLIMTVAVALRAFGLDLIGSMISGLSANAPGLIWRLIVLGISVLVGVLGVYVFVIVTPSKAKKSGFVYINSDDGGQVRIALPAVRQMANQAIAGIDGLQDVDIKIGEAGDALVINVALDVENGVHVPTLTMNLQSAIKRNIENNCGISVRSVTVTVKEVLPASVPGAVVQSAKEPEKIVEIRPVDADIASAQPEVAEEVVAEEDPFVEEICEETECEEIVENECEEIGDEEEIVLTLDAPASEEAGEEA